MLAISFPFFRSAQVEAGTAPTSLIELRGVEKSYRTAAGDYPVLKGINLHFHAGEFISIIGKSGSGKTTLLNMITGIDRPTAGEVWVNGTPLHKLNEGQMARWRGQNLGIVFQFFQLLPTLSVLENILLAMDFAGKIPGPERRKRTDYLLNLVGLAEHANKLPSALSGGQQQRVAIARALANDPLVLIADEPTGNLDSKTAESVFELFHQLAAQGKTVLIVTHDSSLAKQTHRTTLIADGEIANEYVAKALPALNQAQLIQASRAATHQVYEAGSTVFHQGSQGDEFFVVANGKVEIVLQRKNASDVVVAQLGPGQYFGEMQLLHGKERSASVRVAENGPAEVYRLDYTAMKTILDDSETLREDMSRLADDRRAQNKIVMGD